MAAMPVWALVLAYWLHMIGTVLWLGSLTTFVLMVLPAAGHTLEIPAQIAFLDSFQRRLESIATFSLFLLLATGMCEQVLHRFILDGEPVGHGNINKACFISRHDRSQQHRDVGIVPGFQAGADPLSA
jgi:hypothetical protein